MKNEKCRTPPHFIFLAFLIFFAIAAATGETAVSRRLDQFNAGETIYLGLGERFTVTLERATNEDTVWIWPLLPTEIVRLEQPEPTRAETDSDIEETWTFVGVAVGAGDVFAELVRRDDYTTVLARFPIKVQVLE